jgi:hypothetical protein
MTEPGLDATGIERNEGSENVADLVSGNRFPVIAPPR